MKIKSLILICISFVCVASHVAVAQSTWPPCGHIDIQSPNQHSNVYATHNTDRITSTSQLSRVGSLNVDPMATTTYDQDIHITNRRNAGDDPFGGGTLPSNPMEPGTPLTDAVPCLLLLAAAYGIYLRRKNSIQTPDSRNKH